MPFKRYQTLSIEVKEQIGKLTEIWASQLGEELVGVYLHGSIALNRFMEGVSDIDVLIVTGRRIPRDERLLIAKQVMDIDCRPSPLELSAIWSNDLIPWKHPTPCQFHYSDSWTQRYRMMLSGEIEGNFIIDEDFTDADIACHTRLTGQSGICVYGRPIGDVFPAVPEQDFWQSISADIDGYDFNAYHPKYYMSNILVLGRILSYKKEKRILSKYDGGMWARDYIPERFRYILDNALQAWYFGAAPVHFDQKDLDDLRTLLVQEIKAE